MDRSTLGQIGAVVLLLALVPLLAGCSGAGAPAGDLSGGSLKTLSQDHLSAITQFGSWVNVLYIKTAGAVEPPVMTRLPDGSIRFQHTNSDGSTMDFIVRPDRSSTGTITWPEEEEGQGPLVMTSDWNLVSDLPALQVSHGVCTYPNGAQMELTSSYGLSLQGYMIRDGTLRLADGRTAQFHLRRKAPREPDELAVTLPDGSSFEFSLSLHAEFGAGVWPDFTAGAAGIFTSADGKRSDFHATGDQEADVWQHWTLQGEDGYSGDFALAELLAGSGGIRRNGTIVGALRWTGEFDGVLDPLSATLEEVNPSATARDFQIDRWVRNTAALSPIPMY